MLVGGQLIVNQRKRSVRFESKKLMDMVLINANGGRFRFSEVGWAKALYLAKMYGWESAGTIAPSGVIRNPDGTINEEKTEEYRGRFDDWDGNYTMNAGAEVTADDSLNFARALMASLDDIPDSPIPGQMKLEYVTTGVGIDIGLPRVLNVPNNDLNPFEFFGGENKQKIVGFITFCREGGFNIY